MKIAIVAKKGRKLLTIPLTLREVSDLSDLQYMIDASLPTLDKNNVTASAFGFFEKMDFLLHDVIGEGKTYSMQGKKVKLNKQRYYLVKKPSWKTQA